MSKLVIRDRKLIVPGTLTCVRAPSIVRSRQNCHAWGDDEYQRWFQGDQYREWFAAVCAWSDARMASHINTPGLDPPFAPGTLQGRPYIQSGSGTPAARAFLASTTFTVPATTTQVFAKLWGAGGGGTGNNGGAATSAGTGGGYAERLILVTPRAVLTVTVGAAGVAGTDAPSAGGTGGPSAFNVLAVTGAANASGVGVGSGGTFNASGNVVVGGITGGASASDQNGLFGAGGTFGNSGSQPGRDGGAPGGGAGGTAAVITAYGGYGGAGLLVLAYTT